MFSLYFKKLPINYVNFYRIKLSNYQIKTYIFYLCKLFIFLLFQFIIQIIYLKNFSKLSC